MIKRVLGIIFTLLIITTIVFASLEWGNYRSMVFDFSNEQPTEELDEAFNEELDAMFDEEHAEDKEFIDGEAMINAPVDGEAMINGEAM